MRLTVALMFQKSPHLGERGYPREPRLLARLQRGRGGGQADPLLQREVPRHAEGVGPVKYIPATGGIHCVHFECLEMFRRFPSTRHMPATFGPACHDRNLMARTRQGTDRG